MSTFSCSAVACAFRSGRTLKPMMTALEAEASSTSDSVMAPTPGVDDLHLDFFGSQLGQRLGQYFGRALHVALQDQIQLLNHAGSHLLVELVQSQARGAGQGSLARLLLAVEGCLLGLEQIRDHLELVARLGHAAEPQHFHRGGRRRFLQRATPIVH